MKKRATRPTGLVLIVKQRGMKQLMANSNNRILVVGGGTAGLSTALGLADCGFAVTVVERSDALGGHAAHWACMATTDCVKCNACVICELVKRTQRHPGITIMESTEVQACEGGPGAFRVSLRPTGGNGNGAGRDAVEAAAVVAATGFAPYDPTVDPMLGYGRLPGVITTEDLDEYLLRDDITGLLPTDLKAPRVGFIQCVGSRDVKRRREYCSQFCCKTSIRLARRLKHLAPAAVITIFYIDLQIMGKEFKAFYAVSQGMIEFVQGTPAEVTPLGPEGPYRVYSFDRETSSTVARELDRVVLAIGVDHEQKNDALAETLGLDLDDLGFFLALGSHSPKPGVYVTGACSGPMDMRSTITRSMATVAAIRRDLRKTSDLAVVEPQIFHQFV